MASPALEAAEFPARRAASRAAHPRPSGSGEKHARDESLPCGRCEACVWFGQGNHPDFRLIQPEALAESAEPDPGSRKREGESSSRQIRIEQIREVQEFLAIGTHRRGLRVVLVRPAEA